MLKYSSDQHFGLPELAQGYTLCQYTLRMVNLARAAEIQEPLQLQFLHMRLAVDIKCSLPPPGSGNFLGLCDHGSQPSLKWPCTTHRAHYRNHCRRSRSWNSRLSSGTRVALANARSLAACTTTLVKKPWKLNLESKYQRGLQRQRWDSTAHRTSPASNMVGSDYSVPSRPWRPG